MNKKVVLLTGSELRHTYFRKYIANDKKIEVLATFCESQKTSLKEVVENDNFENSIRLEHLASRELTEKLFFDTYCNTVKDKSNPIFIEKGDINKIEYVEKIIDFKPDLIISYGCSIIQSELLTVFQNKFINIHLGLSPYYRGSGTNFWPFVNCELQFIGTTFMHIDKGIDTGEIIHQIRANINLNDTIHTIGNRLIKDSFAECILLINSFHKLKKKEPFVFDKKNEKYYRQSDFTEDSLKVAYQNLSNGLINKYLNNKKKIDLKYPIIINQLM